MPSVDFHENFTRQESVTQGSDRAFGFVITGAFALLAAINLWHAGRIWLWMGLICAGFLVSSLVRPSVLTPLNRLWFKLGLFLHKIVNPIVMGLLFYFAVLPTGLVMRLMGKEAWLGFLNGALTGVVAGIVMYVLAVMQKSDAPLTLSLITFAAMTLSCMVSGMAGAGVPLLLKRMGADPATASSIFLTTATDVVSMGAFLGLAAWLVI